MKTSKSTQYMADMLERFRAEIKSLDERKSGLEAAIAALDLRKLKVEASIAVLEELRGDPSFVGNARKLDAALKPKKRRAKQPRVVSRRSVRKQADRAASDAAAPAKGRGGWTEARRLKFRRTMLEKRGGRQGRSSEGD